MYIMVRHPPLFKTPRLNHPHKQFRQCVAFYKQTQEDAVMFADQHLYHEASDLYALAAHARAWVTKKYYIKWDKGHKQAHDICRERANRYMKMARR